MTGRHRKTGRNASQLPRIPWWTIFFPDDRAVMKQARSRIEADREAMRAMLEARNERPGH